jgi:hypothetical protein
MEINFKKWLNEEIGTIGTVGTATRPAASMASKPAAAYSTQQGQQGQQGQPNNNKIVSNNTKKVSELIKKDFMGSGANINDFIKKSMNNKNMAGVNLVASYAANNKIKLSDQEINDAIAALQGQ